MIEVFVVIGIIAVLAAVVLVAVNPARQFKLARDTQRVSNVNALLNAIQQNMAEHHGTLICNGITKGVTKEIPFAEALIESTSSIFSGIRDWNYPGDIAGCLVPDYLSSMPLDPTYPAAKYRDNDKYTTGYLVFRDPDSRITVRANGELTDSIWVTR